MSITDIITDIATDMAIAHCSAMESEGFQARALDADDWCSGNLRDELEAREIPEPEDMIEDLRIALRKAIATEIESRFEDDTYDGADYVTAEPVASGWRFRDDASREWFIATDSMMAELGRLLRRKGRDAYTYSRWAADADLTPTAAPDAA